MDSTAVHHIADLAAKLGVEARTALVWWFVSKFAIHALWAGVLLLVLRRIVAVLGTIGYGQKLVVLIGELNGRSWIKAVDYERAAHAITQEFNPGKDSD